MYPAHMSTSSTAANLIHTVFTDEIMLKCPSCTLMDHQSAQDRDEWLRLKFVGNATGPSEQQKLSTKENCGYINSTIAIVQEVLHRVQRRGRARCTSGNTRTELDMQH